MKTQLLEKLILKLKTTETSLCSVESCTGGEIAYEFTRISGVSDVFWGSFVVYHNSAKELLGVPTSLLQTQGAVSSEVALSLAQNGLTRMQEAITRSSPSQLKSKHLLCIATTGIAGPTGGSLEKPVGLCYMGIASTFQPPQYLKFNAPRDQNRIEIQSQFTERAIELLDQYLKTLRE